jgi:hypothetical protein
MAWLMQYAPGGTGGMSPLQTYHSFSKGWCGELSDEAPQLDETFRALYESAAAACMAAFGGMPDKWTQAEIDFSQVNISDAAFQCFDRDTYALLQSLFSFHRQFPGYRIIRGDAAPSQTSCPLITKISPNHGPQEGGQQVQIRGANLPSTLVIDFAGTAVNAVSSNGAEATLTTPSSDVSGAMAVSVRGYGYTSSISYTYDPASQTPEPTGSP